MKRRGAASAKPEALSFLPRRIDDRGRTETKLRPNRRPCKMGLCIRLALGNSNEAPHRVLKAVTDGKDRHLMGT
jgi:hypothetical protein